MENLNEKTGKFDMLRDPECLNSIQGVVSDRLDECLDKWIAEIMGKTGLSEIEVFGRLCGAV